MYADLSIVKIMLGKGRRWGYRTEMPKKALRKASRKPAVSYHHGDLRDALLSAARRILEKDGVARLSLRRVARAAGVSPAAPYHHFAGKQALLDAIAAQGFAALTAEMRGRMAKEADPAGRLDASGISYVVFAVENPTLFQLMFRGDRQKSLARAELNKSREAAYGVLESAVADASADGTARPLLCLRLWALVHGIAKLMVEGAIKPSTYGLANGQALAERLLRDAY
jgi:AcrR family transcriptional regulator